MARRLDLAACLVDGSAMIESRPARAAQEYPQE